VQLLGYGAQLYVEIAVGLENRIVSASKMDHFSPLAKGENVVFAIIKSFQIELLCPKFAVFRSASEQLEESADHWPKSTPN